MTGWSVTRKAPSFRKSPDVAPAVEEIILISRLGLINYPFGLILSIVQLFLFSRDPVHRQEVDPLKTRAVPVSGVIRGPIADEAKP